MTTPIDYDLLTRYMSSECSPVERARVEHWLDESPDHAKLIVALQEVATDTRSLTADRKAAMLAVVKGQSTVVPAELPALPRGRTEIGEIAERRFALQARPWPMTARVAAVLLLLGAAAVGGRFVLGRGRAEPGQASGPALRSFATVPAQRLALRLPDGTAVTLGPASLLRLPPDYGTRKRVVDLEGEAAFSVTHDAARPFAVRTARGVVRDLGTRFVVQSYPDDPAAEVVVAEGHVALLRDTAVESRRDSIVLAPGDRARITSGGRVTVDRGVALDPYFAWTAGRLVFRDVPLREAAVRMSRWYDIDVRVASPAIGDRMLSITLDEESTTDVMPLIAASLNLRLTQSGRVYTFHAR